MEGNSRNARYFGVDLDLTWKTIINDIPDLREKISKIKFSKKS